MEKKMNNVKTIKEPVILMLVVVVFDTLGKDNGIIQSS